MISLNGTALGIRTDELALRGLRAPGVSVSVERSEGGVAHVLTAPMLGGRELVLEGVITYAQATAVHAMIDAGVAVALVHPLFSGEVLVLATELIDLQTEYINPTSTDLLAGTIQLLEV